VLRPSNNLKKPKGIVKIQLSHSAEEIQVQSGENQMGHCRMPGSRQHTGGSFKNMAAFLWIILSLLFGCSHTEKVTVPPRVDLKSYKTIGIIDFSTAAGNDLKQYVTQNFIQTIQSAQPGVRVLELGTREHVLTSVSRRQLDPAAIKAIGSAYNIDALISGHFGASEPKPDVHLSSTWQSVRAGAVIEASLTSKLWETDSGVTLWTNATSRKEKVASLKADTSVNIEFGATDPKDTYGDLVPVLVYENTTDFRPTYFYRKVK
jgi:hypothetical protein